MIFDFPHITQPYLIPDALIGVNSNSTQGGQDTGSNLRYTVVVVCSRKAQHASRARRRERVLCGSREGRNQNALSSLWTARQLNSLLSTDLSLSVFFFLSFTQ